MMLSGKRLRRSTQSVTEGKLMAPTQLGKPFDLPRPEPIKDHGEGAPGYGWQLSDEARRDIEEIEANVRQAEQMAG